jgi:hypothetical protein
MRTGALLVMILLAMPALGGKPAATPSSDAIPVPLSSTVREYHDWRIERSSAFVAAVTTNESGSFFGLLCGKTCSYYLNPEKDCEMGAVFPGLINGAAGAMAITLRCLHIKEDGEDHSVMLIDEDLAEALDGEEIGVVIPLENGQFHVSRFSMAGAAEAQRDMLKIADKKPGARDTTL